MTKHLKKILLIGSIVLMLSVCFALNAFAADSDVYFMANADDANTVINTQTVNGKKYLMLPSSADISELTLYHDAEEVTFSTEKGSVTVENGAAFDLTALFEAEQDEYTVTVTKDGSESELTIMKSANIRSMYLVSDDPVNYGRAWVDTSKSNEATGLISIVGTDGEVDHSDKLTQLKGRGNTTFTDYNKKPYQIKIKTKADLINDNKDEACKKWVLLANMFDYTFIHNSITFQLAWDLNMPYTPYYEAIDLYYDGEYRGTYLLTEKTEVGDTRVDIENLDDLIEEANEGNDAYENPVVVTATIDSAGETEAAANSNGSYKYVEGLVEPELSEGTTHHAYLLELEFTSRYPNEQSGFVTKRGKPVVTGNPEYLTKETGAFISQFWQDFEDAVYSEDGYNTKTGKYYYEYVDLDSLVKLYLINELCKNWDGYNSSTFFYLPEDEDIMYAGPVWDFDIAYGASYQNSAPETANTSYFYLTERYLISQLLSIESFRDAIKAQLDSENGEFYNAVQKMIGDNGTIRTLSAQVEQSKKLNSVIWDSDIQNYVIIVKDGEEKNYSNSINFLNDYLDARINWLSDATSEWEGDNYTIEVYPGSSSSTSDSSSSSLSFFQIIINWFKSIIEFFTNLFK